MASRRLVPRPSLLRYDAVAPPDEYLAQLGRVMAPQNKVATVSKLFKEQYLLTHDRTHSPLDHKVFLPVLRQALEPLYSKELVHRVGTKLFAEDRCWGVARDRAVSYMPYPVSPEEKARLRELNRYVLDGEDQRMVARYRQMFEHYSVILVLRGLAFAWHHMLTDAAGLYAGESLDGYLFEKASGVSVPGSDLYIIGISHATLMHTPPTGLRSLLERWEMPVVCARLNTQELQGEFMATIGRSESEGFMEHALRTTRPEQPVTAGGIGKWLIMLAEHGLVNVEGEFLLPSEEK